MKLKKLVLPFLSFGLALFASGLLVAFSDSKVLALKGAAA
jgi:general nucleoside transport system permease protein